MYPDDHRPTLRVMPSLHDARAAVVWAVEWLPLLVRRSRWRGAEWVWVVKGLAVALVLEWMIRRYVIRCNI